MEHSEKLAQGHLPLGGTPFHGYCIGFQSEAFLGSNLKGTKHGLDFYNDLVALWRVGWAPGLAIDSVMISHLSLDLSSHQFSNTLQLCGPISPLTMASSHLLLLTV